MIRDSHPARPRHALLDAETLALVRRASPLPAPPPEVAGDRIAFEAAVEFTLPRR